MKIFHFGGENVCRNLEDLYHILTIRYENGVNEYELYNNEKYPFMTILVNEERACVHYFESEDDCGHYAYCEEKLLEEDEYTDFCIGSPTSMTKVSNRLVIPFSLALVAAEEFFLSSRMSEKLRWFEL